MQGSVWDILKAWVISFYWTNGQVATYIVGQLAMLFVLTGVLMFMASIGAITTG